MKHKRLICALIGLLLFALLLVFWLRKPVLQADWAGDVKSMADISFNQASSEVFFKNIRDWRYEPEKILHRDYFDEAYELQDLKTVWYYLQPLDGAGRIAHTFVVFSFKNPYGDPKNIGISLEARKLVGQEYSMIKGAFKGFTLAHVWASEEDLVTRRQVYTTDYELPLQKYELKLTEEEAQAIFKAFAEETIKLKTQPQFYNTLFNNCTGVLARYVNELKPGSIPWHYSFIFTGKSAEYLKKLGYVES